MYVFVSSDNTEEIGVAIMLQASVQKILSLNWNLRTDCCNGGHCVVAVLWVVTVCRHGGGYTCF
jgi:hypothetical protein